MLSLAQPVNFKLRRWSVLTTCCLMSFSFATPSLATPGTWRPQEKARVDIHRNSFSAKMQGNSEHSKTAANNSSSSE